ncbi:MAG TPA: hypothetical protein VEB22_15560 [Phycisphaerales bacterium]|nr:hypothetical protein [Phycisphaerales bacterium]
MDADTVDLSVVLGFAGTLLGLWAAWRTTRLQHSLDDVARVHAALLETQLQGVKRRQERHAAVAEELFQAACAAAMSVVILERRVGEAVAGEREPASVGEQLAELRRLDGAYNAVYLRSRLHMPTAVLQAAHKLRYAIGTYLLRFKRDFEGEGRSPGKTAVKPVEHTLDELTNLLREELGTRKADLPGLAELIRPLSEADVQDS